MKYKRVSLEEALKLRVDLETYLDSVHAGVRKGDFSNVRMAYEGDAISSVAFPRSSLARVLS